jgi:glutaconate CoA-transferase subunit A
MEGNFGLSPWYRRAVEKKQIVLEEHACATLTAGLRAAAFGVPFQPVGGVHGSDLPRINKWACLPDPYGSGQDVWVIPPIAPDIAVIHANEVNELGDTRIYGTFNWDRIMTRAAKKVFVVAERLASVASFQERPEMTLIPSFMVEAAAIVPHGAWPGSCWPDYEIEYPEVEEYMREGSSLEAHMARAPELKERALA